MICLILSPEIWKRFQMRSHEFFAAMRTEREKLSTAFRDMTREVISS